jgi:hypothetical protein
VTVNVPERLPAGIVVDDGTVAAVVLEEVSAIDAPPAGAGPLSCIVAVDGRAALTLGGSSLTERIAVAGVTGSVTVRFTPPKAAVSVTFVEEATVPAVATNVAERVPAGTTTDCGTVAAEVLELVSVTVAPPAGALPLSRTVAPTVVPEAAPGRSRTTETGWRLLTGSEAVPADARVAP